MSLLQYDHTVFKMNEKDEEPLSSLNENDEDALNFRVYDTMGVEEENGLTVEDAKAMIDGRLPVGTKVNYGDRAPETLPKINLNCLSNTRQNTL